MHYLFRPYIIYRSRGRPEPTRADRPARGWAPVGTRDRSRGAGRAARTGAVMTTATAVDTADRAVGPDRNLALALLAFAITFWAWNIIGPLGVRYTKELGPERDPEVAADGDAGAGRLARPDLTGALTDRFGGRLMFTAC